MMERKLGLNEHLSSGEYTLKDGVFFVPGALRGAIYDINTGRVFSVNRYACEILTGKSQNAEYWDNLELLGLATRERVESKSVISELLQTPSLQFVWFEIISDDCNESCIHCYADSMPPSHRKALGLPTGGFIPREDVAEETAEKKRLTADKWKDIIENTHSLGCDRCQFIGGEPFIYKGENGESVLDLAEYARETGFEFIEIFTNGTLLTERKIRRIKELGLNIAISLYSSNPECSPACVPSVIPPDCGPTRGDPRPPAPPPGPN